MATGKLGLELLANSAANQTLANLTFVTLNQAVQLCVLDKDLATPPGSPTDEAAYIVASGATGDWSGHVAEIAWWSADANAWQFIEPKLGWKASVVDELDSNGVPIEYGYDGSAWAIPVGGSGPGGWDQKLTPSISSGALTIDLTDPAGFIVSLDQDVTSLSFSNAPSDRVVVFTIKWVQDVTGGWAITWPIVVQGTPSQPSASSGDVTIQSFYTDDGGATIYQAA